MYVIYPPRRSFDRRCNFISKNYLTDTFGITYEVYLPEELLSATDLQIALLAIYRHFGLLKQTVHHAYNMRSITKFPVMGYYLIDSMCIISTVKLSIFTCRILETLRSIVLVITLSNQFLVYEAEWNYVKIFFFTLLRKKSYKKIFYTLAQNL